MRATTLLAGLALALGLLLPAAAVADAGGTDLPFKGSGSGDTTFNLATGEVHLVSTGNASHVGSFGFEQHGLLVPTGFADATLTFVATVRNTRVAVDGVIATGVHEGTVVGRLSY